MRFTHLQAIGWSKLTLAAAAVATITACAASPELDNAEDEGQVAETEDHLYADTNTIWPSPSVPVCWKYPSSGDAIERSWVEKAVRDSWDAESGVDFTGWGTCSGNAPGIRIYISDEGPHTSGLGFNLAYLDNNMVLNFTFQNWSTSCQGMRQHCIEAIAVHEFGHALGFAHEQNRPDTPSWCDQEQGSNGNLTIGPWDLDSVMNYCNPDWNGNGELSATDIKGVRQLYGDGAFSSAAKWHDWFAPTGEEPRTGDFNGDGKADIVTFTLGTTADAYVALSGGTSFGAGVKWNGWFAPGGEQPEVGDFNGDGKDDIVSFTHSSGADAWVGLSTGSSFNAGAKWHDSFAANGIGLTGDFNGDGKDDIIHFTHDAAADVYVALSTGATFGAATKWHEYFAPGSEVPKVGDFNGDGKEDIITFTRNGTGDVYVALSNGSSFGAATIWHSWFSPSPEIPGVADFNGDGKDDIVTFTQGTTNDVWVAFSKGTKFDSASIWNGSFAPTGYVPTTGDVNADGQADIVAFSHDATGDVFVGLAR